MLTDNEKAAKVSVEREWPADGVYQKQNNDHPYGKEKDDALHEFIQEKGDRLDGKVCHLLNYCLNALDA